MSYPKQLRTASSLAIGLLAMVALPLAVADDDAVGYPANYRDTFTNYLSLDRTQNHDQVIRLFANDAAMQGPGADGKLAYGSVLVAEIYKAKLDAAGEVVESRLGRRIRDKFALVAVMQREPGFGEDLQPALRNGNWEFGAFKPDGANAGKNLDACRACHAPLKATNYLFSYDHLGGR